MKKPLAAYSVGVRLRQARDDRGLSRRDLAIMAGVGASTISHIESGEKQPRGDTIETLANALEVNPCWLLYGIGSKKRPDKND